MTIKLKRVLLGFVAAVLATTLAATLSGATAGASGFTAVVSGNSGYVGVCKRQVDAGGFGILWAIDTIVTSGAGGWASGFIMIQNSSGQTIATNRYNASNGTWAGGTDYASLSAGDTFQVQGTSGDYPGGFWKSMGAIGYC